MSFQAAYNFAASDIPDLNCLRTTRDRAPSVRAQRYASDRAARIAEAAQVTNALQIPHPYPVVALDQRKSRITAQPKVVGASERYFNSEFERAQFAPIGHVPELQLVDHLPRAFTNPRGCECLSPISTQYNSIKRFRFDFGGMPFTPAGDIPYLQNRLGRLFETRGYAMKAEAISAEAERRIQVLREIELEKAGSGVVAAVPRTLGMLLSEFFSPARGCEAGT